MRALVGPGDVLLTTVGPFKRWGGPARRRRDRRRRGLPGLDGRAGVHPARVPGPRRAGAARGRHAAAGDGLRLRARRARGRAGAGGRGHRRGPRRRRLLRARRRAGGAEPRHPRLARGRLVRPRVRVPRRARAPARARPSGSARSPCKGKDRPAISVGGAEHFTLPAAYPRLREVNVYLGWFGQLARATRVASRAGALVTRLPGARGAAAGAAARSWPRLGDGPAPGTTPGMTVLHRGGGLRRGGRAARARSTSPARTRYDFTAGCLAWAARRAAARRRPRHRRGGPARGVRARTRSSGAAPRRGCPASAQRDRLRRLLRRPAEVGHPDREPELHRALAPARPCAACA